MKKLLMFTAAALVMAAPVALAEDGQEGGPHGGGQHKGKMFEKADANGDGAVTAEEFNAFHGKVFEKMDVNGDGLITQEEQQKRRAEWQEKMREHREQQQGGIVPEERPLGAPDHVISRPDGDVSGDEMEAVESRPVETPEGMVAPGQQWRGGGAPEQQQ